MVELSYQYLAGFIDGEGYVSIRKVKRGKYIEFKPMIVISNTNNLMLEQIKLFLNLKNKLAKRKMNCNHPKWKDSYHIYISNVPCLSLCKNILPFIIIKKEQVCNIIEFYNKPKPRGVKGITKEEFDRRDKLVLSMNKLNKRGL